MNKYDCIVVDDEELARKLLVNYVSRIESLNLIGTAKNALEANELCLNHSIDIMLLDIQMPDMTGIDLINILDPKPQIILTTAYQDYALEGYNLNVTDYLLKPFGFDRFLVAINKAVELIKLRRRSLELKPVTNVQAEVKPFILIKNNQRVEKVWLKHIIYIEGMKEYVAFHTDEGRVIGLYALKQLINELPDNFIRIHRSYIVNKDFVKGVEGPFVLLGGLKLPIGKSYKQHVNKNLFT